MNKTFFFLLSLLIALVSYNNSFAGNTVTTELFQGKPSINSSGIVGNYPSTPFLFYIPTTGQRPIQWSVEGLPKGLKLDAKSGIITGVVASEGNYAITLKAKNALGNSEKKLTLRIGNDLLLTPPMGWSSWNTFGMHINEEVLLQTADAMVANGMRDLGYSYINIDDHWQMAERGADGHIQVDAKKFPRGIKYVADYLHERGFKLGIYSDAADKTCGGVCGSYGFEEVDAQDFASWGVDLLKYDYCNAPDGRIEAMERYAKMGKALKGTGRSIVFSLCEWGQREPWKWGKQVGGHLWRVSGDIGDAWNREAKLKGSLRGILNIIEINAPLSEFAGPGGWNDPDMLVAGIGGKSKSIKSSGCTTEQYKSHFSLWCMMASPLFCGNDVRSMNDSISRILLNPDLIAINQDVLGKQAERNMRADYYDVWVKPLFDGRTAVACFNRMDFALDVELNVKTVEGISLDRIYSVDDRSDISATGESLFVKLAPHQCKIYIFGRAK